MQRNGLEWLFRLVKEPRRLAYRYLVYNPLFIVLISLQLTGLRQYHWTDANAIGRSAACQLTNRRVIGHRSQL